MPDDSGSGARHHEIESLLLKMRQLASLYLEVRGDVLNLTNEIGELEAARHLGLRFTQDEGHDAVDEVGARICIRSRIVPSDADPGPVCVNGLKLDAAWDAVLLVLLDQQFKLLSMYRVERAEVELAEMERKLDGSRGRKHSERPAFSIKKFRRRGRAVWPTPAA